MKNAVRHHPVWNAVLALLEDLATPRALTVAKLIEYGEWDQLVALRVDPTSYIEVESLRRDYIATELLRKCSDLETTFDRRKAAVDSFWDAELLCARTNERLTPYLYGCGDERVSAVLAEIRKEIRLILGRRPNFLEGKFGPGATYRDKGKLTSVPDKITSEPTVTSKSVLFTFGWSATSWARSRASRGLKNLSYVSGNRFSTVPKTAVEDRGICIEPSINVFYQLGLGRVIRERLRLVGIDLKNGQETHRQVACRASLTGSHSTIDLSKASDTVSAVLVKLLLPASWYEYLNMLRSQTTEIDRPQSSISKGRKCRVWLEKFSSMGNGFTFELETLIYIAACRVACKNAGSQAVIGKDIYAYGDDLIVPSQCTNAVLSLLRFLGFVPNMKKTFTQGSFRESCGGDYFDGADVRPHYLKELPNEPQDWISLANAIHRLAAKHSRDLAFHPDYRRAWFRVLDALPSSIRGCRGPKDLGDICIHDDESRWSVRSEDGIRYIRTYSIVHTERIKWIHFHTDVQLAYAAYICGSRPSSQDDIGDVGITFRNARTSYKLSWTPYS